MDSHKVDDNAMADMSSTHLKVNDLSEYELMEIFGYFSFKERVSLSRICQKWRNCIEKTFRSEMTLNRLKIGSNDRMSEKAICLLIRKCCNVRHIDLRGMDPFMSILTDPEANETSNDIVVTIVSNCCLLESIDFGSLDVFNEYFENNVNYFKQIKRFVSQYFTENDFNSIIDSQVLESIDISRNDNICRPELKRLGPKITELQLMESRVYEERVIQDLCCGNGKRLRSLSIDIKDKAVMSLIGKHLTQLKTFKAKLFSNGCDLTLFSNLKLLKTLELEVMDDMTLKPQEFSDLIRSLKGIDLIELKVTVWQLNSNVVNDNSFFEIRKHCQSIEKLEIIGTNGITGAGIYDISQLKNLKHLNLMDCFNINDNIDIVITSCPSLRELILHNCSQISNLIVDKFIERAKTLPKDKFYLDVIDTNVLQESLPLESNRPNNLKLLYEFKDCIYDCEHESDPNEDDFDWHHFYCFYYYHYVFEDDLS